VYQCASLAKEALTMASANDVRKLVLAANSESAG
jgi:hypothetical protein